jgi:chloride channel 2
MQLDRILDLDEAAIDAAPFQLVLGTSLYKVHTLFSLLALSHAYVTNRGQLVGVVAVREVSCLILCLISKEGGGVKSRICRRDFFKTRMTV